MTNDALRTDVFDFLYQHFLGSTLDDGYSFVRIQAPVTRRVHHDKVLEVFDELVDAPSWLVMVNVDPSDLIDATRIEQRVTSYVPDWNYSEEMPQWIAELPARPHVDLGALRKRMRPLGALALISSAHRLVFDIHYMRLHAASQQDLDTLVRGRLTGAFFV
jgi:hypothetical protein